MKKVQKKDSRFVVRRAQKGAGLALFTNVPFKKGDTVIEYVGKRISTPVANELTTRYLFEVDENWTIDGSVQSNIARYINHGCKPNCESEIIKGRVYIQAIKNIKAGEEITYDYGDEYFNEFIKPMGCKCVSCLKNNAAAALAKNK